MLTIQYCWLCLIMILYLLILIIYRWITINVPSYYYLHVHTYTLLENCSDFFFITTRAKYHRLYKEREKTKWNYSAAPALRNLADVWRVKIGSRGVRNIVIHVKGNEVEGILKFCYVCDNECSGNKLDAPSQPG